MGGFSNYWENKILDHVFGKGSYTPPTIHVALSTTDPLEDGSGVSEPSGSGYARVQTSASDWNAATAGVICNAGNVTFPAASASWGTITHFALFDSAAAGNMLACGALQQPEVIGASDTAKFQTGDLEIGLD